MVVCGVWGVGVGVGVGRPEGGMWFAAGEKLRLQQVSPPHSRAMRLSWGSRPHESPLLLLR